MNIKDTLDEIGILETNIQIEKYMDDKSLLDSVSSEMPIPTRIETKEIINNAIEKILELNKKNIFMLSNEIALIEKFLLHKDKIQNIIVCLSRNLSDEQLSNIKSNVPKNSNVTFVHELEYPNIIKPRDSILLVLGYLNGNNSIVTNNTYRMIELYKSFLGKKVFVSCISDNVKLRQKNFISINSKNYFDIII